MQATAPSERTRVRRMAQRADYDAATVHAILDEAPICHLAFTMDNQPFVIPTLHVRVADRIFVHGSAAGRTLRAAAERIPICVTVTILDGLVLARSAFHHSLNYRSVVIFGSAEPVIDAETKLLASRALVDKVAPGRWEKIRAPNAKELGATTFLSIPIAEASAKVRTGGPIDDAEDMASGVWAGVMPIHLAAMAPIAEPSLPAQIETPRHVRELALNSPIFRAHVIADQKWG